MFRLLLKSRHQAALNTEKDGHIQHIKVFIFSVVDISDSTALLVIRQPKVSTNRK